MSGTGKAQKLTALEERFCVLIAGGMRAISAYREVYQPAASMQPSNVSHKAIAVRRRLKVIARIKELQSEIAREVVLEQADVIREIHAIATSDIRGIVDETGRLKLPHQLDAKTAAGISKFKMTFDGTIEYQFHSKTTALDQACKILGLYERDNSQKTDPLKELLGKLSGKVVGVTPDNSPMGSDDGGD